LRDLSRIIAIRLQKNFGLQIGDTVGVCLPNLCEFPIIVLGAIEAGMIVTSLNPIYTPGRLLAIKAKQKIITRFDSDPVTTGNPKYLLEPSYQFQTKSPHS
jgi:acyl-CoA synthetase (AMP-forming)/AMP-acid ligase II